MITLSLPYLIACTARCFFFLHKFLVLFFLIFKMKKLVLLLVVTYHKNAHIISLVMGANVRAV